jgi:hypothetical protein
MSSAQPRNHKAITAWFRRTEVLDKTEEMKAQQTMTDTNRFVGTRNTLLSRLSAWVARVVACTLPKRLQSVL